MGCLAEIPSFSARLEIVLGLPLKESKILICAGVACAYLSLLFNTMDSCCIFSAISKTNLIRLVSKYSNEGCSLLTMVDIM